MSEEESIDSRPLRWRFWLVLFAPAIVALGGMALGAGLEVAMFVNVFVALPLNFVCSNDAAKQIVRVRDPRGGSSPWMFLWAPLIFFLNVAIVFGGCALAGIRD